MRCPNCNEPTYHPAAPCPRCQFEGEAPLVETLDHVRWLLDEIKKWGDLGLAKSPRRLIETAYTERRKALERELGLRLPPFTAEEAKEAWPDFIQRETLLNRMAEWQKAGWLKSGTPKTLDKQTRTQLKTLTDQLEGHERPAYPHTDRDHLAVVDFLLQAVDYLSRTDSLISNQAKQAIQGPLLAEKKRLEIALGLRVPPVSAGSPTPETTGPPAPKKPPPPQTRPAPPPPAVPLRERLWQTLLSERTLQGLLALGIFLLFSAALSFVIWGWRDFSAPLRVAIPSLFTSAFFGIGWYVRTKTPLYRSGIALSAIAALLIPIDFYTVYANYNIPPAYWPHFWLTVSLFCLGAYIFAAFVIRSRFFGYLTATAAGSTVLALIALLHQNFGLSLDWQTAALSGLAFGLILAARRLDEYGGGQFAIFSQPFRAISILAAGVIMLLTLGWRYLGRDAYDTLHSALIINWWLGGLILGWGARRYRSRSLGLAAAVAGPVAVYLTQAALFQRLGIDSAWHAAGLALLTPLYLAGGYKLKRRTEAALLQAQGRTAIGGGLALLILTALWPVLALNHAAAAVSHTLLAGTVILAALLGRRPAYLYGASLLAFSAVTFVMTGFNFTLPQLSVGWAALAIGHIILALNVGTRVPIPLPNYAGSLVIAGYTTAGLALPPPLLPYDGGLLAYALGNWLALTAWGARLAHQGQSGFPNRSGKPVFHWLTALPLPLWLGLLFANRGPLDFTLPLALAILAWALTLFSYRLGRIRPAYSRPWHVTGMLVSGGAPVVAFIIAPTGFTPAVTLLAAGLLYFADALSRRQSLELVPAGFVTAGGYLLLLNRFQLSLEATGFGLALLIALYILGGLETERRKIARLTRQFFTPLYLTAHRLSLLGLAGLYLRPVNRLIFETPWTDSMRLWSAGAHLVLGLVYGLYAWRTNRDRWAHGAVWLIAAGGAFAAVAYSSGRGSSAAIAAAMALLFILAERTLHRLRRQPALRTRQQAFCRFTWRLYRRPLLAAGWTISAAAIGLALLRNLWLLGGGRPQQIWAVVGLLLVAGLYALAARLFRQARFVWLATLLVFAPWTILTQLGWLTAYRPTGPALALSWLILAWLLFLAGLFVSRFAARAYTLPLMTMTQLLLPFSLIWGAADVETGRFTVALAIGLYGLAAQLDYGRTAPLSTTRWGLDKTRFLYPALGLTPVWSVYLLAWLVPGARHEHYGLMLLVFGPLGLAAGEWLSRISPLPAPPFSGRAYALPAYLTGYAALIAGTMLTAHEPALLALALLFDALVMLVSARLFRNPLGVYPAAVVTPVSLLLVLNEVNIPASRQGWWLIGLASIYLALAWSLRRARLAPYGAAPLTAGFALIALGLPPSSQDQVGSLVGYGAAATLYTIAAFWLRQPLLLTPAGALAIVPYAVGLQRLGLAPPTYGLALFPGAGLALALGRRLDHQFGAWRDFPWGNPAAWPAALGERFLGWWGLPLYTLGFGLASAAPFFTAGRAHLTALNCLLLALLFGWAIYRFRLRVWLLAAAVAGHLAAGFYLQAQGWPLYSAGTWLRFLPVVLLTAALALGLERSRAEGSPLEPGRIGQGWSRPLYIILAIDIIVGQLFSLAATGAAATVTLSHAGLLVLFASIWTAPSLAYGALALGVISLIQGASLADGPVERLPVVLAILAVGYGISGYGLAFIRHSLDARRVLRPAWAVWELPLQRFSLLFSFGILGATLWLGLDIAGWLIRAAAGLPFRHIVDPVTVQMTVGVLAWLGLLYLTAAVAHRWLQLGYLAIGMLLGSWLLQAFYIQQWTNLQWYALPAGLYLITMAYLEWRRGRKTISRQLDYMAILLMMGSLFWQTLLFGWAYALLLGAEGLLAFWWGSARRLRRFLYAGMGGVVLATVGQLVNSLWSINQWIVFGAIGLLLVIVAIVIERKLDDIKSWQKTLEAWE